MPNENADTSVIPPQNIDSLRRSHFRRCRDEPPDRSVRRESTEH